MTGYYTFQPVKMHRNILASLKKAQMGKTVILCENTSHKIRGKFGMWNVPGWINALLTDLWVTAQVSSLPEVKLPIIEDGETQTERLNKTILYEWGTARLELRFLLGDPLGNWASFGETSIKNPSGYRYRKHRVLDLITDNPGYSLEENWKLGVQLLNVGFGDLKDSDRLDITGAWTQEFVAIQAQPPYVVNTVSGSGSNSPSPSPSPTPTPIVNPTFTLAYSTANSTTAIANTDEKLKLTITDVPNNTQLTVHWYKSVNNVDTHTGLVESITTSGSPIELSTLKFRDKGTGNYKAKINYNNYEYSTLPLSVTVNPEITTSPTSGDTAGNTQITVSGNYFTGASSRKYTYSWIASDGSVAYTSVQATLTLDSTGAFSFTVGLNTLQSKTTGNYRFRLTLDSDIYAGFTLISATNTTAVTVTALPTPTVTVSPSNVDSYTTNVGTTVFTTVLQGMPYTSGDLLIQQWFKSTAPTTAITTKYFNYIPDGTGKNTSTQNGSDFYTGSSTPGTYFCKVSLWGSSTTYQSNNVIISSSAGGLG